MKNLTNDQIKVTSGGSHGVLHENGIAHQISCPSISQSCLDKFLICTEIDVEDDTNFTICMDKLENECGGLYGVIKMINCLDAHGL